MKAVSPVIATLILIAIAVIAGVFVLRQFLTVAGQVGTQQYLEIQDLTFLKQTSPDGTKMTITMSVSVKNAGDRQIIIKKVEVPDANWSTDLNVILNPGETYTNSWTILKDIPYTIVWETGQSHTVKITYQVAGTPSLQTVSQKGAVR